MAASLSADGRIWTLCRFCRQAIWRYVNGKAWRRFDYDSDCALSPIRRHYPER